MTVRPLEAGNAHMRRPPRIARIGGTTAGQHYFAPRQGRTDCSSWPQGVFPSHLVAYIWRFNAGFSLQNCGQYSVPWVYKDHKKPPRGHAGGNVTLKACCTLVNRKIPVQKSPKRVAVQLAFSASAFHKTTAAANTTRDVKHLYYHQSYCAQQESDSSMIQKRRCYNLPPQRGLRNITTPRHRLVSICSQ